MRCGGGPNRDIRNEPHPTGLARVCPGMVDALGPSLPALPSPLCFGFVSQRGSLHRSAFTIVCGLAPKSYCLCSFATDKAGLLQNATNGPLALAGVSHLVPPLPQDTCEPPWLWLAQQPGQRGLGSCIVFFFLLSSALTLLPAKSLRMWISGVCICLFGHLS